MTLLASRSVMRCVCGALVASEELHDGDRDRCPCGARRVTRFASGAMLVHRADCNGQHACNCV